MGRSICYKDGVFFEWSSEVNAPVTPGLSESAFHTYYQEEYGTRKCEGLEKRMAQAKARGTELRFTNLETLVQYNHLGPNYSTFSLTEVMDYLKTLSFD